jgi:hypothetical protein
MALIELPLRNDIDAFDYRIDLDGSTYSLSFAWNTRDERWFIYLRTGAREDIAFSPLLLNADLWTRFRLDLAPPGIMFLIDPAGGTAECGRFDLGQRCKLLYSEAEGG